jgi:hypothetical protein
MRPQSRTANADFIVTACNNHDKLMEALRRLVEDVDATFADNVAEP